MTCQTCNAIIGTVRASAVETLGEEPFGWKMKRARERSGLGLREVAEVLSQVSMVSYGTVARLERDTATPIDRRRRALAVLCVFAYGFEPAEFGLDPGDLPSLLDPELIRSKLRSEAERIAAGGVIAPTGCMAA